MKVVHTNGCAPSQPITVKHRKNFYLDDSTISYVTKFQDENHFSTFTAALSEIVEQHQHRNDVPATRMLVEELAKQVAKELADPLTRVRLGVNNADRNSDIILLMLNTLMGYQQFKTFLPDDTLQLQAAKAFEKERIANFRQRKLNAPPKKEIDPGDQELTIPEDDLFSND